MPETTTTLDKLKMMLQISGTSQDTFLSQILDICEGEFLTLTHRTTRPDAAEGVVLRMAMVRYNTLKSEGLASISIDGLNENYIDYNNLMPMIRAFRKVVIV